MGAIRSFITAADQSDKLAQEQNAHLDTLSALADAKADLFREKITQSLLNAGQGSDKTIPITAYKISPVKRMHTYLQMLIRLLTRLQAQ